MIEPPPTEPPKPKIPPAPAQPVVHKVPNLIGMDEAKAKETILSQEWQVGTVRFIAVVPGTTVLTKCNALVAAGGFQPVKVTTMASAFRGTKE